MHDRRFLVVALCYLLCFFNDTATPEIYTLSLHDALPICRPLLAKPAPSVAFKTSASGGVEYEISGFVPAMTDRKSTRLNSSHGYISYAVFCLKKKNPSLLPYKYPIS